MADQTDGSNPPSNGKKKESVLKPQKKIAPPKNSQDPSAAQKSGRVRRRRRRRKTSKPLGAVQPETMKKAIRPQVQATSQEPVAQVSELQVEPAVDSQGLPPEPVVADQESSGPVAEPIDAFTPHTTHWGIPFVSESSIPEAFADSDVDSAEATSQSASDESLTQEDLPIQNQQLKDQTLQDQFNQSEPAQIEPMQVEPVQADFAESEIAQTVPVQPGPFSPVEPFPAEQPSIDENIQSPSPFEPQSSFQPQASDIAQDSVVPQDSMKPPWEDDFSQPLQSSAPSPFQPEPEIVSVQPSSTQPPFEPVFESQQQSPSSSPSSFEPEVVQFSPSFQPENPQPQEVFQSQQTNTPDEEQTAEHISYVSESSAHENVESAVVQEGNTGEQKSLLDRLEAFFTFLSNIFGKIFGGAGSVLSSGILKTLIMIVVVGGVIYLGYAFQIYQSVYNYAWNFVHPPQPAAVKVEISQNALDEWGIHTAFLFAQNHGSVQDIVESAIQNTFYFGTLAEPKVQGETGITPAYYYGQLRDLNAESNAFMKYIEHIRTVRELYKVDVYAMLDQTTDRAKKLLDYIQQLKDERKKTADFSNEILSQIDDLKISYNSLSPDRTRFEQDFFVSLQNLAPEKSDFLLKSFIDVSQKQTALKARLGALQKLSDYHLTVLKLLDIRIKAVDSNKEALIQGIRVVDIPGANIDIIIKGTAP